MTGSRTRHLHKAGGASSGANVDKQSDTAKDNKQSATTDNKPSTPDDNKPAAPADTFNPAGDVKPTDAQTIPDIKAWLDAHKVTYPSNASKGDLLTLVNQH